VVADAVLLFPLFVPEASTGEPDVSSPENSIASTVRYPVLLSIVTVIVGFVPGVLFTCCDHTFCSALSVLVWLVMCAVQELGPLSLTDAAPTLPLRQASVMTTIRLPFVQFAGNCTVILDTALPPLACASCTNAHAI